MAATMTSNLSRDYIGSVTGTAIASSTQHTTLSNPSSQSTAAPSGLGVGAIGGIVAGALAGLLAIGSVIFVIRSKSRGGTSTNWTVFNRKSIIGGRTAFEKDGRARLDSVELSGRLRGDESETASARLQMDG